MVNNNSSALRYANIVFFALTVVVNVLAGGTTLIGGQLTVAVSDANPALHQRQHKHQHNQQLTHTYCQE